MLIVQNVLIYALIQELHDFFVLSVCLFCWFVLIFNLFIYLFILKSYSDIDQSAINLFPLPVEYVSCLNNVKGIPIPLDGGQRTLFLTTTLYCTGQRSN